MKEEKESKLQVGAVHHERRKHPRFAVDLPIEYSHVSSPGIHGGRAINISEGGLLVSLPQKMEIGRRLKVKLLPDPDPGSKAIETVTEVMWVDTHVEKHREHFRCGVRFVEISSENVKRLKHLLKDLSS